MYTLIKSMFVSCEIIFIFVLVKFDQRIHCLLLLPVESIRSCSSCVNTTNWTRQWWIVYSGRCPKDSYSHGTRCRLGHNTTIIMQLVLLACAQHCSESAAATTHCCSVNSIKTWHYPQNWKHIMYPNASRTATTVHKIWQSLRLLRSLSAYFSCSRTHRPTDRQIWWLQYSTLLLLTD